MPNVRLIARLDIKTENLVKGIQLEGLRVIGKPEQFAKAYYDAGADEIIYIDIVASLYGRNNLTDLLKRTAHSVFIPMTVGGGIRNLEDVSRLLQAGADKVAINTAAVERPELIAEVSNRYGSQCMVLSIEAKRADGGGWEVLTENGRERSGIDVIEWAKKGVALGAGEILLTSVDREGTQKGFDLELVKSVSQAVRVPIVACGGMGNTQHLVDLCSAADVSGVAMASILHYEKSSFPEIRVAAQKAGISVREVS